jgi:hypothetical protein
MKGDTYLYCLGVLRNCQGQASPRSCYVSLDCTPYVKSDYQTDGPEVDIAAAYPRATCR